MGRRKLDRTPRKAHDRRRIQQSHQADVDAQERAEAAPVPAIGEGSMGSRPGPWQGPVAVPVNGDDMSV